MNLEYQSCNTFVDRYLHSSPLGGEILAVTIGRIFLFLLSSTPYLYLVTGVLLKLTIVVPIPLAVQDSAQTKLGANPHNNLSNHLPHSHNMSNIPMPNLNHPTKD